MRLRFRPHAHVCGSGAVPLSPEAPISRQRPFGGVVVSASGGIHVTRSGAEVDGGVVWAAGVRFVNHGLAVLPLFVGLSSHRLAEK